LEKRQSDSGHPPLPNTSPARGEGLFAVDEKLCRQPENTKTIHAVVLNEKLSI
jgi:hypothetical protein